MVEVFQPSMSASITQFDLPLLTTSLMLLSDQHHYSICAVTCSVVAMVLQGHPYVDQMHRCMTLSLLAQTQRLNPICTLFLLADIKFSQICHG